MYGANSRAHLRLVQASLCLAAIRQHERTKKGRFVNYNTLPDSLWEEIAPDHFGLHLTSTAIAKMKNISRVYSKGTNDNIKEWEDDEKKMSLLTKKQQKWARKILEPYYDQMEEFAKDH